MNPTELFADLLLRNLELIKGTLADFSDTDMLVRPCPGANHAAWQLGHLIKSERSMIAALKPDAAPELPAGFPERFTKDMSKSDDPAAFARKDDLLALLVKVRTASAAWARSMSPADLDQATPENLHRFAPTVGHLLAAMPTHTAMHVGQFQVIRRKLGKPVIF